MQQGASIGANATILPGITIGKHAMVGAGSVVTRDVPPETIVVGNPARITGYVGTEEPALHPEPEATRPRQGNVETIVEGVTLCNLPLVEDLRGLLSFGEANRQIPFDIKRYFLVFGVSGRHIRGAHAHKKLHQFLICVSGSCHCVADDGRNRQEFVLDSRSTGLHIPPMVWGVQYKYSADATLLVLASDHYDGGDYIRDYSEFLRLKNESETNSR